MAGIDPTGLTTKRLADLIADIGDTARSPSAFGPAFAVGPDTPNGQLIGVFAAQLAEAWEGLAQVYRSFDPNAAEGEQLDNLCALVGVTRELATKSQVTLTFTCEGSGTIPQGTMAKVPGGASFSTKAAKSFYAPPGTSVTKVVEAEATVTGAVEAEAASITEMVDAVFGVSAVTNAAAAVPGRDLETDAELRVRRARSLQMPSAGTEQAIRSRLEQIDEVVNATVVSNRTDTTDSMGLPPKSFRAILWPSLSSEGRESVARAIWETMPAGIYSDGTEALTVTDDQGYEQTVRFSYATEVEISVVVNLVTNDEFPSDGVDLITAAIMSYGESLAVGDDVLPTKMLVAIMAAVPGIDDMQVFVGVGPDPEMDPYVIELDEIAVFDEGRITVVPT